MKKIKDRIILGIISGLIGNLSKQLVSKTIIKLFKFGNRDGIKIAAGIFLPKRKVIKNSIKTRIIGVVADNCIGSILGVVTTYLLGLTGKDNYRVKGIANGHFFWVTLYGFLSRMGATSAYPMSEDENIIGFINHTVYGWITSEAAVRLGDSSLFKPHLKSLSEPETEKQFP